MTKSFIVEDSIPHHRVRIGAFDFDIKFWDTHETYSTQKFGECSSVEFVIRMQREFQCRTKAVDTLFHEILHAMYYTYGIRSGDDEERTVAAISTGLVALFRDNPWLIGFIHATASPPPLAKPPAKRIEEIMKGLRAADVNDFSGYQGVE